ncbi:hypothetical protein C2845_PM17G10090 [Panicum miliaceum]|uniref:Uncharacterized protein n=1 Tax=Panicum miliaceum TaxID=4540 RepID=A0A3L6Q592_PANMI|nr:hypothetical protein C2845_PM17G10090 [Panicum miliaceum]
MDDVVTGVMATLLPKLGELLAEEYQLQAGVRGDLAFLRAELESMEAALLRISEATVDRPPGAQDRLWARELRELTYDAKDCVEAFLVRLGHRHHAPPNDGGLQGLIRGFVHRGLSLLQRAKACRDMAAEVRGIKRRVAEVSERRVRYKVDGVAVKPDGPAVDSLRLSALYTKAAELVGTGERSDELVRMLMEGDEASSSRQVKVVSIAGFGGLGKTTLAKIVYEKLKGQFDCAAFVTVSLNPNMEKLLRNMLCQLGNECDLNDATCGVEARIIDKLREFLQNKRYLIVLDDIWSYSVWDTVMVGRTYTMRRRARDVCCDAARAERAEIAREDDALGAVTVSG